MIQQIDHFTIAVANLDEAAARYEALLGAPPNWLGAHPELGTEAAIFGVGQACIELLAPAAGPAADGLRAHIEANGDGFQAMALYVEDADAARASFRESGLRAAPVEEGVASTPDGERRFRVVELSPRSTRGLSVFAVERSAGDLATLTQAPEGPGVVSGLDHAAFITGDLDAARELYGGAFGMRIAFDSGGFIYFATGGTHLVFAKDPEESDGDGFYGLAYRVADLRAAHARLSDSGFDLSEMREGKAPGTRVFTVRDAPGGVPTLVVHQA